MRDLLDSGFRRNDDLPKLALMGKTLPSEITQWVPYFHDL